MHSKVILRQEIGALRIIEGIIESRSLRWFGDLLRMYENRYFFTYTLTQMGRLEPAHFSK